MKDIDFDELDRAVNSLISPGSSPAEPTTQPVSVQTVAPVVLAASPAERRSSGRFMDVVHPSSDMRPTTVNPRPVLNQSVATPPTPTIVSPVLTPEQTPINTQESTEQIAPSSIINIASDDASAPLESPFLTDAKVEKRPLGAFSTDLHVSPAPVSLPTSLGDSLGGSTNAFAANVDSKSSDQPVESNEPIPEELQPDLLSVEASEDTTTPTTPLPTATTPIIEPSGPTSITQQYSEQPNTGDKPAGNIFDTEAYKKPQVKQKKKNASWMIILWIVGLLIIGAGIGAAVYFLVLPRV